MSLFGIFEDTRSLLPNEITEAKKVFLDFLPYDQVVIGNILGLSNAPFTEHSYNPEYDETTYTLHVGPEGYQNTQATVKQRNRLIHELTHVWQGSHSFVSGGYQVSSLLLQGWHAVMSPDGRKGAYKYTSGAPWTSYNVEQQAHIVTDWYANGCSQADPLFPYIRDHIRRK